MQPFAEQGEYINFLGAEDGGSTAQQAHLSYGETKHRRLVELKNRYDPGNRFRLNANVAPSGGLPGQRPAAEQVVDLAERARQRP